MSLKQEKVSKEYIKYLESLVQKARNTGKITNCLKAYYDGYYSRYSKPIEVLYMLKQLFASDEYKKQKKIQEIK